MISAEKIEDIMNNFDFVRVRRVMEALDWTWWDTEGVPSVEKIRERARELLNEMVENSYDALGTGGLYATKIETDSGDGLRLTFEAAWWENS